MRRWLAVFLLILLPLQLSWAVAAAYCGHDGQVEGAVITGSDGGAMPPHVGHHEHRHEPPAGASASADAGSEAADASTAAEDDCGICHFGHTQPPVSMPVAWPGVSAPAIAADGPDLWSSRGPDRHERPNWRLA